MIKDTFLMQNRVYLKERTWAEGNYSHVHSWTMGLESAPLTDTCWKEGKSKSFFFQ